MALHSASHQQKFFAMVCILIVLPTACGGTRTTDVCTKEDKSAKCQQGAQADADVNELMQMRIRVGSSDLSPESDSADDGDRYVQEEKLHINVMTERDHAETCKVDRYGLIQSDSSEEHEISDEKAPEEEDSDLQFDDSEFSSASYSSYDVDHPDLAPYREELALFEDVVKAEVEADALAEQEEDDEDDDETEKEPSEQEVTENSFKQAAAGGLHNRKRKMTDIPRPPAFLQTASRKKTIHTTESGVSLVTEKIFDGINCHHNYKVWIGSYEDPVCAEKVHNKGYTYYLISTKMGWKHCEAIKTARADCPIHQGSHEHLATYRVYEGDKPIIFDMYPKAGSIAGGQLVTFRGAFLYEAHDKMEGKKDTASSLKAPVQIIMTDKLGMNMSLECPLENFASRQADVKCVTTPLAKDQMIVADTVLYIMMLKISGGKMVVVERPKGCPDVDEVISYKYSTGATPELESVSPVSVGPGQVLTVQGLSCSGIVEGDPVQLVKITGPKNDTALPNNSDAEGSELVPDPETAYGHICEPWPPLRERMNFSDANKEILKSEAESDFGAIGLDAMEFKLPDSSIPENLETWMSKQNLIEAARWIQPRPYLQYAKYWRGKKHRYVAKLQGRLIIDQEGDYEFHMQCQRIGFFKLAGKLMKGTMSHNKGTKVRWGHHGKIVFKEHLKSGMHQVVFGHAVNMDHPHHSGLEVKYKGKDTGYQWIDLPENKLRAGITRDAIATLEQTRLSTLDHQEKYLVSAKEILGKKSKGIGKGKCPDNNPPKLVEFKCKVAEDMEPGFYDIVFQDHEYGESITPVKTKWLTPMLTMAAAKVIPVIKAVAVNEDGAITVEGHGLDYLQDSGVSYNGYAYEKLKSTQDVIELVKGAFMNDSAVEMGARGLLREYWYDYKYPDDLESKGSVPAWGRASKLKTNIMTAPGHEAKGFSERLTGLMVPPFSGECRWIMKGNPGFRNSKLFFNEVPMSEQTEVVEKPEPPKHASPFMYYAGRYFSGTSTDFENLGSVYKGPDIGGAISVAVTTKFANHGHWNRVIDFGKGQHNANIFIARDWRRRHMVWRIHAHPGGHYRQSVAHNVIRYGETQNWLFTVSDTGTMRIYLEGVLVGQEINGVVPPKVSRPKMYVAKSNWGSDSPYKGDVQHLRFYEGVLKWGQAYQGVENPEVTFETVRYGVQCEGHGDKDLGWKASPLLCAKEAKKRGHKFFRFGRWSSFGKCYGESASECEKFWTDHHYDVYKVTDPKSPTENVVQLLPFPADPAVSMQDGKTTKSAYYTLEEGKAYPFKLDRKVQMLTQETGPTGWNKLGLECRSINGTEDKPELGDLLLPKSSYQVEMKFKDYSAAVTLPKSAKGYTVKFGDRTEDILSDTGAGYAFVDIFGPKCTTTKPGGVLAYHHEFRSDDLSPDSACGTGRFAAPLNKKGTWTKEYSKVHGGSYKLKDKKFLHMCYKIAPLARVNMLVKCKVGYRNRHQWFSIGMTDGLDAPQSKFHHDRKRAAQWPLKTSNGTTTGTWECVSINLYLQVTAFEDYERRFSDISYGYANTNPGHSRAPGPLLDKMEITDIYIGTGRYESSRWVNLEGESFIDTLVISSAEFAVTRQTPSSALIGPPLWSGAKGLKTSAGWMVEWFNGKSGFLWKPGSKGDPYTKDVCKVSVHQKLFLDGCGEGKPEIGDCNHYGWRAKTALELPANTNVRFWYWNDDNMEIFVNEKSIGKMGCCVRGWHRYRNFKTGAAGIYRVEVHLWQGGGGNYGFIRWDYNGKTYEVPGGGGAAGVSRDHEVLFKPAARSQLGELKTLLKQVQFIPKDAAEKLGNKVEFSPSAPADPVVVVKSPPATPAFTPAIMVGFDGPDAVLRTDVKKAKFNAMFAECPVVKYWHNGAVWAIYKRLTPLTGFDAYENFVIQWRDGSNKINKDFKLYSSEDNLMMDKNPWEFCNYNAHTIGFPRDCGPTGAVGSKWFRLPDKGGSDGAYKKYGFEIQTGTCASPMGSSYVPPKAVSFEMNETSLEITKKISSVAGADVEVTPLNLDGMRWLDMSGMSASQSSLHYHGKAELAIDGQPSKIDWNQKSCTHTQRDKASWWSVNLGKTVNVAKVKISGRNSAAGHQLRHATIAIDGKPCHDDLMISDRETKEIACAGEGSTMSVYFANKHEYLSICEFQVGTFDGADEADFDSDSTGFAFKMTYIGVSGYVPAPKFGSDLADEVKVKTLSSGTRVFPDITDQFFRVPHDVAQVTFDPWSSYICETASKSGCAPVFTPSPPKNNTGNGSNSSNLTLLLQQRGAVERVTTHNRRHPQRKWRLPPRFHTEETLEKMRRRVFGFAGNVKGWSETSSLLQMHAGHQGRFESQDPRKDPNMLAWSDPASWGGEAPPNKESTDIVFIPEGKTAKLDMNVNIRFWVIEGNVVWDMTKDIHMEAEAIVVNGGQLLIGSETEPYAQQGQITLHGHWHTFKLPLCGAKTIFQTRGNIEMHGIPIPTTWTELEITAFPGDWTITVYGSLDLDWKPGNMIVIAATDRLVMDCRLDRRDSCQVEERFISWIEEGLESETERGGPTTTIFLDRPLVYRHLAQELDPMFGEEYCLAQAKLGENRSCGKTQVRAEVGLLTRNIVVKGSNYHDGSGPAGSEGFGGHLMHAEKAKYSYIEFFWMGQAFQMGRYPLHLHLTGLNPTSYIKGCSIRRTFMRGITVHGTHSATIKDNVLYNVMAHGYFIEDGNEHNNVFENNFGVMVHKSFSALVSDQTPAVFWLRNPSNYFRNNHAAGGAAFGFWFDTLGQAAPLGIKQFENIVSHNNGGTGIWIDIVDPREGCTADPEWTIKVPARDSDEISRPEHDKAPDCGSKHRTINELKHITTFANGQFGITLFETGHFHLINHRSIGDTTGILVWGIQSDDWPDPTNKFNGPTLMHGVYSSFSDLPKHFKPKCSVGGPWDDTLLLWGTQFIGPVARGHFCPCFECLAMEGGYETRTAKLGWHAGAGTKDSVRASWPWLYASLFFDMDGTLTEDSMECQFHGCYLHAPFDGDRAGMYSRRTTLTTTPKNVGGGGDDDYNSLVQEDDEEFLIETDASYDSALAETEGEDIVEESVDPFSFMGTETETRELIECKKSIYAMIKPEKITSNRYNGNRGDYGKGQMFRSSLYFEGDPSYCGHRRTDDYIEYDMGEPTWVTGVQTRGRKNHDQWVTKYKIQYTEDSKTWVLMDKEFMGNSNRNTIKENRFQPIKATKIRLLTTGWRSHNCMRLDFIGCDGTLPLTMTCVDSPYLDQSKRTCSALERDLGAAGMQDFCKSDAGGIAMHTALSAKQACCACGAGVNIVAQNIKPPPGSNATDDVPEDAPIKVVPGGTGYFDPKICKVIDATGGVVCTRAARMNTITVTSAGLWHMMTPIDVQSDFGFAEIKLAFCYQQYEFTVMTGNRYLLIPPYTPKMLVDWDVFNAEIRMDAGDKYVLQWETIHNPDGYTVEMDNVKKHSICDEAEMQYDSNFNNNQTLIDILKTETDMHSVQKLKLSQGFIFDMYKVAHLPLLDRAAEAQSAGMWGYIQANESYDFRYWYPGMFNVLITEKGVSYASNYLGPWNGYKRNPGEQAVTRKMHAKKDAADFGFSHFKTPMSWKRWDLALPPPPGQKPPAQIQMSRLRFLVTYCNFNPASFGLYSDAAAAAVAAHEDVKKGLVKVPAIRKFKWSQWPAELGGKPKLVDTLGNYGQGLGNVSIEANWEVTLDEDVYFINKLNISGVLKFEDKANCCKITARYIFVGPLMGKIEAGTESAPFSNGVAHIILKGQPMTPPLRHFRPHIWGSAKWMKSKFLAVQGSLSLHGKTRSKTWVKIAKSVQAGSPSIVVDGGDFKVGDVIAINHGAETKKITAVSTPSKSGGPPKSGTIPGVPGTLVQMDANSSDMAEEEASTQTTLMLDSPIEKSYKGKDFVFNGKGETRGWMAAAVGLVDGYNVIVEGEDTEGVPMCHKSKTQLCPYANGLGGGMNLHDFAKEMRHYLEKTGAAQHPNCRPCLAVSEMAFAGYIIGMAHFHYFKKCPKDHGVIDVTGVAFKHGSQIRLYHGFTGGNYPHDLASLNFPAAWSSQPHVWWKDPVWAELKMSNPPVPEHQIAFSAFNNTHCGGTFSLTNAGVQVFPTKPVTDNVILSGAVGINGAARPMADIAAYSLDMASPVNDNFDTMTEGVGAPTDFGTFGYKGRHQQGSSDFQFVNNLMMGATLVNFKGAGGNRVVTDNVINGPVYLDGCPTTTGSSCFANNYVNSPSTSGCIMMRSSGTRGVSDNTVFGCRIAVAFNWFTNRESTVRRMRILDSTVGIHYWAHGPDSKAHDMKREQFEVTDVMIYAPANGGGTGIRNPKVHSNLLGQPVPDWWHGGTNFFPMGHAAPCLFFKSMLQNIKFVGFQKSSGGVALSVGEGHQGDSSDADYHPVVVQGLTFDDTHKDSYMRFAPPSNMGNAGVRHCLQIECDGRRNSLIIDEDGSLIGTPGTVVSAPNRFYDKLKYVDPMGFDTMEDLIPMPARYDAVGDAIPFPTGVAHGSGGGLEYECEQDQGCMVLYMQRSGPMAGMWVPHDNQTIEKGEKIVAIREDGGHIFLDPLHHGWDYALGTVYTGECKKTMDPSDSPKPESQHARRYGRVDADAFGTHLNASKIPATVGPVYTVPGIYRPMCVLNSDWGSYECPKGKHRHLLIEVMDWNHMVRRWAPVSVEVNDKYAPQGGAMNILTGPAMYWTQPMMRLQTFHALGHVGMRHNVYFSADPPSHLRLHLQYAAKTEAVIVCVYYGLPNLIQAYVGGSKKPPMIIPTWDNLVFAYLNTSMPHGTYYYDRIGVETLRPGYLYTVIKGDQHVDFKISHKIVLTSKVTVTANWGGWKNDKHANGSSNDNNNNFYKSGLNGLVRNIALLIGAPPNKVAILGQGKAKAGTFWNKDTTSEEFAEWMWKQNKSMDRKTMSEWKNTPGAKLKNKSQAPKPSLLQVNHRHVAFLQQFSEERRSLIAEMLVQDGPGADTWYHKLSLLSAEEEAMVYERRVSDMLERQGDTHHRALRLLQDSASISEEDDDNDTITMVFDSESETVPATINNDQDSMKDRKLLEQHDIHVTQLSTEGSGMQILENCVPNGTSMCTLPSDNGTLDITSASTDFVPTKNNPKGWMCNESKYNDGKDCDCDCGIWDPDCDLKTHIRRLDPAILNSTDQILLLDAYQAELAIKWVDKNYNMIIDKDEILSIPSLGASSLYSMAETIRKAQEMGENAEGENGGRRGNFAWMETVNTPSCNKLLVDAPLTPKLAVYTPKCVKDSVFEKTLGQPTGRCSIQPQMQIGSQCLVPGGGFFPAPARGTNGTTDKSICGTMLRIFRGGLGAGGTMSAGVGPSSAQWFHPGGTMVPKAYGVLAPIDMKTVKNGLLKLTNPNNFKNGFSFYCRIKFHSWFDYGRIFAFYSHEKKSNGGWEGYMEAHVRNGDHRRMYDEKMTLEFFDDNNRRGPYRHRRHRVYTKPVPRDEEMQLLFTMTDKYLKVWKNGVEIGKEKNRHDWDTTPDFSKVKMMIGRRAHRNSNYLDAEISDIRVWTREVTWDVAIQGSAPNDPNEKPPVDDDGEDVDIPCISSKKNTYDFACQAELSEELAKQLGHENEYFSKYEVAKFEKRAKMGDITICSYKASTKGVVFAGKFGDGLTAEYYRMHCDCHRPPFTFGKVPTVVRVDPEVKVPDDFKAPSNEFSIRWGGKLLIHTAGSYEFEVTVNDGAWVAVDSFLVVDAGGCPHPRSSVKTVKGAPTKLSAGGHDIAILYFNDGPSGSNLDAKMVLKYKGPDTQNTMTPVPTANLGSDPLRLAKLAKDTDQVKKNATEVKVTPYGKFIYDEEYGVALMNKGSCDFYCQKGSRKSSAAQFKFFCSENVEVSFLAEVSAHSQFAMIWWDDLNEVTTWNLKTELLQQKSSVLMLQKSAASMNMSTMSDEHLFDHALGVGEFSTSGRDYTLATSAESPSKALLRGTHTLFFQGRPKETELFALKYLQFAKGKDKCKFYLEGKDTHFDQC